MGYREQDPGAVADRLPGGGEDPSQEAVYQRRVAAHVPQLAKKGAGKERAVKILLRRQGWQDGLANRLRWGLHGGLR